MLISLPFRNESYGFGSGLPSAELLSDTSLWHRAPTWALTSTQLPFPKLVFSSRTMCSAADVITEQIGTGYPCREQPGLQLHSFPWGHFCELNLAQPCLFAFDLTCWTRSSVHLLPFQQPCPRALSSRRSKEAATISVQQAHLKIHEQFVKKQEFFPSVCFDCPQLKLAKPIQRGG